MYNDGVITNEFTGYYDNVEQEYEYPTAQQNLLVVFNNFYLSAMDGDFTADGTTFSWETGEDEDITIGNAPAKVLSTTMLNPDGLMESLTWGDGAAYIGVVTSKASSTVASGTILFAGNATVQVRCTSTMAYKTYNGTTLSVNLASEPGGIVIDLTTNKVMVYTANRIYSANINGGWAYSTASPSFQLNKYANLGYGIVTDANGLPSTVWYVDDTKATGYISTYIPMGTYDFSNVDAAGITFQAEVYDKMTLFDADATSWAASIDYTTPKTISDLITALMTEMGMTASIDASAVNMAITWSANPITSYSVTYREVLKWLAQMIGCNVRIGRTGLVEFYVFDGSSPVATITPDTVISDTRTKASATVPKITRSVCYNTLGASYSSGSTGSDYYFVGNPFLDPSGDLTPLTNLNTLLRNGIPAYYPTAISITCYDPRIDTGDFITLQMPDGTSPYNVPVMRQSLVWNGTCTAEIVASGNQVRQIPDSMKDTDLAAVVDSNPSAVVNKIQAVGISADWITTGKLTVQDTATPPKTIFEADKDNHTVTIGGFTVEDDQLKYEDASKLIRIDNGELYAEDKSIQRAAYLWPGLVGVQDIGDATTPTGILYEDGVSFTLMNNIEAAYYDRKRAKLWKISGDESRLEPNSLTLTDGVDTAVLTSAMGTQVSGDTGSISLANDTSLSELGNFSLDAGLWFVSITIRFGMSGSGRRAGGLSLTSGGSAISNNWNDTNAGVSSTNTYLHASGILKPTATTTYYINAYQTSGGALTTIGYWDCVRLL